MTTYPNPEMLAALEAVIANEDLSRDDWQPETMAVLKQVQSAISAAKNGSTVPNVSTSEQLRTWDMESSLRAADAVMQAIDKSVRLGNLGSRTPIADARLNYGQPFHYKFSTLDTSTLSEAQGA